MLSGSLSRKRGEFFPERRWPEAHALIRIRSERKIRSTEVTSTETRYYISSTKKSAKELNEKVRDHVETRVSSFSKILLLLE